MTSWHIGENLGLTSGIWHKLSLHMLQLESRYNPARPSCSSQRWSTWGIRSAMEGCLWSRCTYIRSKTGYYRTFIPQYSALTKQLNGIKKVEKFLWNKEIERDFVELKKTFTDGWIQAFPDFWIGDPFILTTDWSKENIAWGVMSSTEWTGEVPRMLGEKV